MSEESASRTGDDGTGESGAVCDGAGESGAACDGGPEVRRLADWDADTLLDLRRQYGSPSYVLDLDRVRENYRRLAAAFPDAAVHYAAKANALGDVFEALDDEGAGVECASAGEVVRALDAGVPSDRVHYTAVNPPAVDLDTVVELWTDGVAADLTVTVGAEDTVARLATRGYDGRLCVRVNPGVGAGHHEKVQTGANAKFGVPRDRALDVAETATQAGMDVVGVHAHAGSGIHDADDLDAHREMVARVGDVAREFDAAHDLEFVDVGGGLGVPYREADAPLDLDAVADATRDALGDVDAQLVVEPGRYLVADAGVLLTDVNTVKETPDTTVLGVDAGMTTLARPAIYGSYHPIRNVTAGGDGRGEVRATVTGPICESSDVFAEDRPLAEPVRGDVLAIGNAGAYGYEMASNYNTRPRPATAVLEDGSASLARRRETLSDITTLEL
ncbi:diaminopimelate decarboxylase [Halorubellus litoreus]|uniref:Diaminopimelate decarboxylase n=1 Tax=Halorubellus litoreus TaxID=755308 RepID=A0ABD5V7C0_9EURY